MIGVLALQGNFEQHCSRLDEIGAKWILVKTAEELDLIDALIIPGGESSVLLKLCPEEFRNKIIQKNKSGMSILATCAGLIFIANKVSEPEQESLNLLDIEVERNAYGRQVDSFITQDVTLTPNAIEQVKKLKSFSNKNTIEGVFIRAPKITNLGKDVEILATYKNEPVLVKSKNIIAATFHPECSNNAKIIHELFLECL